MERTGKEESPLWVSGPRRVGPTGLGWSGNIGEGMLVWWEEEASDTEHFRWSQRQ